MTAHTYSEAIIHCDAEGCAMTAPASELPLMVGEMTAGNARRILRRRGWRTDVPGPDGKRRDYCPAHSHRP